MRDDRRGQGEIGEVGISEPCLRLDKRLRLNGLADREGGGSEKNDAHGAPRDSRTRASAARINPRLRRKSAVPRDHGTESQKDCFRQIVTIQTTTALSVTRMNRRRATALKQV